MDDGLSFAVKKVFVKLFNEGLIYKDKRLVNWDTKLLTAISDLEVEQREMESQFWYIKYPLENTKTFIVVATTRPETMLGDVAVAVNPKDERYNHFIGKNLILPIANRKISIILYLSDDFDGGTTKFAHREYKPPIGHALIFPSNWCFPHCGSQVTGGKKRVAVTWYFVNDLNV